MDFCPQARISRIDFFGHYCILVVFSIDSIFLIEATTVHLTLKWCTDT